MSGHNPVARYCIVITDPPLPRHLLRDDVCCPACDELATAARLDPDFADEMRDYPFPCPIRGRREADR